MRKLILLKGIGKRSGVLLFSLLFLFFIFDGVDAGVSVPWYPSQDTFVELNGVYEQRGDQDILKIGCFNTSSMVLTVLGFDLDNIPFVPATATPYYYNVQIYSQLFDDISLTLNSLWACPAPDSWFESTLTTANFYDYLDYWSQGGFGEISVGQYSRLSIYNFTPEWYGTMLDEDDETEVSIIISPYITCFFDSGLYGYFYSSNYVNTFYHPFIKIYYNSQGNLSGLNITISGVGENVTDLWALHSDNDIEDSDERVNFSIYSNSDPSVVFCSITDDRNLICQSLSNGVSYINVTVNDSIKIGTLKPIVPTSGIFKIEVTDVISGGIGGAITDVRNFLLGDHLDYCLITEDWIYSTFREAFTIPSFYKFWDALKGSFYYFVCNLHASIISPHTIPSGLNIPFG